MTTKRLTEANKRNNASDQASIQAIHDNCVKLGARCGGGMTESRLTEYAARNSKSDMGRIQEMHDLSESLGAACGYKAMQEAVKTAVLEVIGG